MNDTMTLSGASARAPGGVATAVLRRFGHWFWRCRERSRQRRLLAEMEPRLWRDIGVSRADVVIEVEKPFWR